MFSQVASESMSVFSFVASESVFSLVASESMSVLGTEKGHAC